MGDAAGPSRKRGAGGCVITLVIVLLLCVGGGVALAVLGPAMAPGLLQGLAGNVAKQIGVSQVATMVAMATDNDGMIKDRFGLETKPIEGLDPGRYAPMAGLAQAQAFAGPGATLVGLRIIGLRQDGTVDLTAAERAQVEYEFSVPATPPTVSASATAVGRWHQKVTVTATRPGQMSQLSSTGGSVNVRTQFINQGLTKRSSSRETTTADAVPPPTCALPALWQVAIQRGAPADALAEVNYARTGYAFRIRGTNVNVQFGGDCQVRR